MAPDALVPHLVRAAALAGVLVALALCAPASAAPGPVVKVSQCTEQALRAAVAQAPSGATIRFGCHGTITVTKAGGGFIEVLPNETADRRLTIDASGAQHHAERRP